MKEGFFLTQTAVQEKIPTKTPRPTPVAVEPIFPQVTPTPTPTPTPRTGGGPAPVQPPPLVLLQPPFTMNVTYGGNDITDGQLVEWGIFEVKGITIEIDTWDLISEQSDYKFKLDLNSSETGFCAYNGNFECDPTNLGNEVTTFTPGRAPSWTIVRCGLGSPGNNGFQVIAQLNSGGADIALNNTGEIPLAWHREDRQVSYLMQLSSIEGARAGGLARDIRLRSRFGGGCDCHSGRPSDQPHGRHAVLGFAAVQC